MKRFFMPQLHRPQLNPEIYDLSCPDCDFNQEVELLSDHHSSTINGETAQWVILHRLPERCPRCGAVLKKTRIPVCIAY